MNKHVILLTALLSASFAKPDNTTHTDSLLTQSCYFASGVIKGSAMTVYAASKLINNAAKSLRYKPVSSILDSITSVPKQLLLSFIKTSIVSGYIQETDNNLQAMSFGQYLGFLVTFYYSQKWLLKSYALNPVFSSIFALIAQSCLLDKSEFIESDGM